MSRDLWSKQLRIAGADTRLVEDVLAGDVPVDGLQHAGSAVLHAEPSEILAAITGRVIEALGERGWTGDGELIAELEHHRDSAALDLIALPVELDQLGEALDRSAGSASHADHRRPASLDAGDHVCGVGPSVLGAVDDEAVNHFLDDCRS
ncbi:MAG: hypothetical protein GY925_13080, partial [Actinomycetia bacterium]|nr:hypothetical protein [Actinomycetes bacterium]